MSTPTKPRSQKRRREICAVLAELSTPELEIELLRRRRTATEQAITHEMVILRALQKRADEASSEILRLHALVEGGRA